MSTEVERRGDWMQTASGRVFWPLDPHADEVFIEDIAHALSNLCRFGGHVKSFYSVAEHSVYVSRVVEDYLRASLASEDEIRATALCGLLHDATEAYCVDVPRPIKPYLTEYAGIEEGIWLAIIKRFDLHDHYPGLVKYADEVVLATEARDVMLPPARPWRSMETPLAERISVPCRAPWEAEQAFIRRFIWLGGVL